MRPPKTIALSVEELFQRWDRPKVECTAFKVLTLGRMTREKQIRLKWLGWEADDIKSLPSDAEFAREYLSKKYGKEVTQAPLHKLDWLKSYQDFFWELLWEGEEDYKKEENQETDPSPPSKITANEYKLHGPKRKATEVQKEMNENSEISSECFMKATYRARDRAAAGEKLPIPLGGCGRGYLLVQIDETGKGGAKGGHIVQKYIPEGEAIP